MSTPMARLRQLAQEARDEYERHHQAGGELRYPAWIDDIEAVCSLAEQMEETNKEAA